MPRTRRRRAIRRRSRTPRLPDRPGSRTGNRSGPRARACGRARARSRLPTVRPNPAAPWRSSRGARRTVPTEAPGSRTAGVMPRRPRVSASIPRRPGRTATCRKRSGSPSARSPLRSPASPSLLVPLTQVCPRSNSPVHGPDRPSPAATGEGDPCIGGAHGWRRPDGRVAQPWRGSRVLKRRCRPRCPL